MKNDDNGRTTSEQAVDLFREYNYSRSHVQDAIKLVSAKENELEAARRALAVREEAFHKAKTKLEQALAKGIDLG